MKLVCIYSMFPAEAPFNWADYTTAKCQLSPFTLRCPRGLPYWEEVHQWLTFDETPPPALAADSKDEEDLPVAELNDPMWDKELVPDSREYLCIHEIPRLATPTPSLHQWPHPHSPTKDFQTHHPSNLAKWECPQNLNWWNWIYWMISQTYFTLNIEHICT